MQAPRGVELTSTNSPCGLFLKKYFLPPCQLHISLAAMEERVHPIPFRTWQLSSPSPMILHIFMWESRPLSTILPPLSRQPREGIFLSRRLPALWPHGRLPHTDAGHDDFLAHMTCTRKIGRNSQKAKLFEQALCKDGMGFLCSVSG